MALQYALGSKPFVISAELTPIADADALVAQAKKLLTVVDAVQVTDNPSGRAQISALACAAILRQAGIDPVLHISCRDRNRIALRSDLLGAAGLGISSLLVMRSGPLRPALRAAAKPVGDMGATDLIAAARAIRENESPAVLGLARSPDFFIGALTTVFDAIDSWQPRVPTTKIDAGAQFLQSQLCLDARVLRRYMKHLVAARLTQRCHLIATVAHLASAEAGRSLRDTLRAALIPAETVRRLRQAPDAERASVEVCADLLRELASIPGVSGVNFLSPADPVFLAAALEEAGLRREPAPSVAPVSGSVGR
jgi:methylenetetrahydrofolate reductase (NADPH)